MMPSRRLPARLCLLIACFLLGTLSVLAAPGDAPPPAAPAIPGGSAPGPAAPVVPGGSVPGSVAPPPGGVPAGGAPGSAPAAPGPGVVAPGGTQAPAPPQPTAVPPATSPDLDQMHAPGDDVGRGRRLRRFGADLFHRSATQFPSAGPVSEPDVHRLGAGDRMKVVLYNVKGGSTTDEVELDARGETFVPGVGVMRLAGMTLDQASAAITRSVSTRFPNMRARLVSQSAMGTVVYVLGEATRPGRYELPVQATLMDALLAAGGPGNVGTYRRIRLQRGGATLLTFDLYDLLVRGRPLSNVRLHAGDRIFIPVKGAEVAVEGEVPRPALYELNGEKTLRQVISLAGGLLAGAYVPRAQIERVSRSRDRMLLDVDLAKAATTPVTDGDRVSLLAVLADPRNSITLEGEVKRPGVYAYTPGLRVGDLIRKAEGLRPEVYGGYAEVYRIHVGRPVEVLGFDVEKALARDPSQDLVLRPSDRVVVFSSRQVSHEQPRVRVLGQVTRPGEFERFAGMRVVDLVRLAGGLLPEATDAAELARIDPSTGRLTRVTLHLDSRMSTADATMLLQDQDVLVVRKGAQARRWPVMITLAGEVRFPGEYAVDPDKDDLRSVLQRAGGLEPSAYAKGAVFVRERAQIVPAESLQLAGDVFGTLQKIAREFALADMVRQGAVTARAAGVATTPSTSAAGVDALLATAAGQEGVALPPRLITRILSSGRIPIDLPAILAGGKHDPGLRDGDAIFIPRIPKTVLVSGAVSLPSALPYRESWLARDYIGRAGGFTRDAETDRLLVVRVNGELVQGSGSARLEPGDIILVAPKAIISRPSVFEGFLDALRVLTTGAVFYQIFK